ncbi:similar to PDZ-domain protein scribble (predicted), isoform CRA_e [Rattus norvegicus]|uniref:Similar to PDZ-domain protein scribble (Predicted), isoform CRA_e n=1 Tax=Rattus norvegicus TaxID=10116 RepID=A6HS54_RAT|nr:similar to PDZ-domain protein scribble (predicted), isoform CRA_e [Rattus norvegicus]
MTSRYWGPLGPSARSYLPILACHLPSSTPFCVLPTLFPVCGAFLHTLVSAQCALTMT